MSCNITHRTKLHSVNDQCGFTTMSDPHCHLVHIIIRMYWNSFGDFLTSSLAPSTGQYYNLSNILVYNSISAKLMAFPSASVVLCVNLLNQEREHGMVLDLLNMSVFTLPCSLADVSI